MAKIIFKSNYIKGGTRPVHLSNLVNYIATREGVAFVNANLTAPASAKQQVLTEKLLKEFPQAQTLLEYQVYQHDPTIQNAQAFISLAVEQNFDSIAKKRNYVDYISNRPNTEKRKHHGLFTSGDAPIILSKVAEEVANHKGNVWTPIISLTREDAVNTGLDNAESWQNTLSKLMPQIAEQYKIKLDNLRWYGSFHNQEHHPHVHLVLYSVRETEGFLTPSGIEHIKSALLAEIFHSQVQALYMEQTTQRTNLKKECQKVFAEIKNDSSNPMIQNLIFKLHEKLHHTSGKKQYGYLQEPVKKLVDCIVDELAKLPSVKKSYDSWYALKNTIYNNYANQTPDPLPLSRQKEFKSIKNMIVEEVINLDLIMRSEIREDSHETPRENQTIGHADDVNQSINLCVSRLLKSLSNLFVDSLPQDSTSHSQTIDSKLFQILSEKKQAQGQKFSGHSM